MKDIINYHQKHHNLTQLAYQSAWQFLMSRFFNDDSLEEVIANKLHFAREARREIEELTRCIDWKRKKEGRRRKEAKEVLVVKRWFCVIENDLSPIKLWNKVFIGLFSSIACVHRAAKENHKEISEKCICSLRNAAQNRDVKVDDLLNGGAVDAVLENIIQPTLNNKIADKILKYFVNISKRLKKKNEGEMEEEERKELKRKVFDKLEEEGYEDTITSFHKIFVFLEIKYSLGTLLKISDYFVIV
ncbi:uncharacterized protein MONOS_3662 [Monocercomonoides exilis]|uniref:uncharacterized protein n=1 Tax=Monocercomonoides exilis TaxID=2049356 RepID=UPI0035597C20|nr:hypothetical protein MONOS_3662 [Monocercomonoides exilis]|eukprot:MONOS_3662.1-p1 / transcript=MONOS_3662.1 / gene=MONOS_3662 / organism=Monocercomonoides_exilis_PA203 / gene_product=unspecified product / transcript_product=unspecified product / location=Mono_scaffold00088:77438-78172(+) / protein_length=245 / sequence_SO=supercontig / SO=protein_coding / is_pseudo=false